MKIALNDLDFIDLISERHTLLRERIDALWNVRSEIHMSNSEWYILSRVYDQPVSIADISATVTISRQAIHKFIRQMEEKGLITIFDVQGSKKLKGVKMTPHGQQCYDAYEAIKTGLCDEIGAAVGQDNLALIVRLFQQPWFDEKR